MKRNYQAALAFTLKEEGGYVDNPHDPGGKTNHGITQRTLDLYRAKLGHPTEDVRNISGAEIGEIYATYWKGVSADTLPAGVDLVMFDIAVMSGPKNAELLYQHGAHTYSALNDAHLAFLKRLTTFGYFGKGWTKRIDARELAAREIASKSIASEPIPATVPKSDSKPPVTQGKSTMEKLFMLPSVAASLIGLAVKYGPTVAGSTATAVSNFPDIEAKGKDMIQRLKKVDVAGAMVDFNAIIADLGITQAHVTAATATAAQDGATLSPSIF